MKIELRHVAFARSGDKGDTANIGLVALTPALYPVLEREVTAGRMKEHFRGICHGTVERYELPNLQALNFLLHESLDGGGTSSLMLDAQGKTFATALLRMEVEVPERLVRQAREARARAEAAGCGDGRTESGVAGAGPAPVDRAGG